MSTSDSGAVEVIDAAPWSLSVRLITVLCSVILIGISLSFWIIQPTMEARPIAIVLILIFVAAYAFSINGFVLTNDSLYVLRPFFKTRIKLQVPLQIEKADKDIMRSIRVFGNGGFFAVSGWFWNRKLGRFRVFVTNTDIENLFLIKMSNGSSVLISPEKPLSVS